MLLIEHSGLTQKRSHSGKMCLGGGHKGGEIHTREKKRKAHTHSDNVQGDHCASLFYLDFGGKRRKMSGGGGRGRT